MAEHAGQRAQWLREVFGDVLPETTSDERGDARDRQTDERDAGDRDAGDLDAGDRDAERERWYRENRPPHHD